MRVWSVGPREKLIAYIHTRNRATQQGDGSRTSPASMTVFTSTAETPESAFAGDGDLEGLADLTHPLIAESAKPLDERPERHALD